VLKTKSIFPAKISFLKKVTISFGSILSMEPESIVTHKKLGNKVMYKVHWRGLAQGDDSWVNAEDFHDKGMLKLYWTYHLDPNNQPKGSGRRKYVPEYIQQFYRDYIQNPLIEFPDFQPEADKPKTPKVKQAADEQQYIQQPNEYSADQNELLKMPDLSVPYYNNQQYIGAQPVGYVQDPNFPQNVMYKVKLPDGTLTTMNRTDAHKVMPQQMQQFLTDYMDK
jgi:hypothetical protein